LYEKRNSTNIFFVSLLETEQNRANSRQSAVAERLKNIYQTKKTTKDGIDFQRLNLDPSAPKCQYC